MHNNGYIKFKTMHYTILTGLQQRCYPGNEVEFYKIKSFKTTFVQLKRGSYSREWIK